MNRNSLLDLLRRIQQGDVCPETGADMLKNFLADDVSFARIDHHRMLRRGLPEVVYGAGKTAEQITVIAERLKSRNAPVLITRLSPGQWSDVNQMISWLTYSEPARCAWYHNDRPTLPGNIVICAAGTSDIPVAEEASITLETVGHSVTRLTDIGVAGLHRLLSNISILQNADAVIAVAGMEGALPGVIAGIVDCPVIGVPTSVGYGAAFGGVSALLTMLNACSGGLTVVNIDNGFGAAYAAAVLLRKQYAVGRG
jgi:pyridinium-3,5-biscarboxylic acid mononucleotide synthase